MGEAGPGHCGQRSVRAPQGHVFLLDLPRLPGVVQPLAPAGAAGHPCLPHSSPHPMGRGPPLGQHPIISCPLHPSRPSSLESWVSSRPPRAQSHSPAHPAHKCPCSRFLHTLSTWAHTFTSQVSTLWPVRRPSSPWPGDRSRQMLFLQAWEQGLARVSGGWGQAGDSGIQGEIDPTAPYLR